MYPLLAGDGEVALSDDEALKRLTVIYHQAQTRVSQGPSVASAVDVTIEYLFTRVCTCVSFSFSRGCLSMLAYNS